MKIHFHLTLLFLALLISPTLSFGQKTFLFGNDTTKSVVPHNLIHTSDGNFIISGEAYHYSPAIEGYPDFHFVVKFDLSGDVIWSELYDLDWYAQGEIYETNDNYQIFYTGDGSYVCNGLGLSYPFTLTKSRKIGLNGDHLNIEEEFNPECSNSVIHRQPFQESNWFLTKHSNIGQNDGYLGLTEVQSDGTKNLKMLDIIDDPRYGSLVDDSTIYIIGPKDIHHLDHDGNLIKSFAFDSIRYEETIRAFFNPNKDSLIVFYSNSDGSSRKAVIRTMDLEGNLGKETIIIGFRYKNVVKNQYGQYLLVGQDSENDMAVIILDDQIDSVTTKNYAQNKSSYGTDILNLDDGSYMVTGRLGGYEDRSQYIVIIDSLETTTGIQTNETELFTDIKLYPNPNNGIFKIEIDNNKTPVKIKIFDSLGREVYTKEFIQTTSFQLNHLQQGIYTARVLSNDQIITKNFIIQKD